MAAATVDSTVRIAFGLVHGLLLAMAYPLFFILFPDFTKSSPLVTLLVIIPMISYVWGFGLSAISQFIYCNSVALPQVALASAVAPLVIFVFSLLVYFLPFLRAPVIQILPQNADGDIKYALGFSFYLLWAGIYGQTLSSIFLQQCPP